MNFPGVIGTILITGTIALFATGCSQGSSEEVDFSQEYYLFVGTYTQNSDHGIYVYKFNADDGSLAEVSSVDAGVDPSYLAVSSDHKYVYATNEYRYSEESGGEISAFSFDKSSGTLSFINKVSSQGNAPCYISLDHTGRYAFAANYSGGSFAMFPVNEDGSLGEATTSVQHEGRGHTRRQQSPHLHCAYPTPDNQSIIVSDLGTDKVSQYALDIGNGSLKKEATYEYETEPGSGPRHITFHPNGKFAYLVTELNGSIVAFNYEDNSLHPVQKITTLPENYEGEVSGADIHVSPDGQFLYASNREDLNNIVIYEIEQEKGRLRKVGQQSVNGVHPRNFTIDPTGNFLLVANQFSNNVVVFKRDRETGELNPAGVELEISQPVCLKMISVE